MLNWQQIAQMVSQFSNVEQAVVELLHNLSTELKSAVGSNNPQAVHEVADGMNANAAALARAVVENTPASNVASGGQQQPQAAQQPQQPQQPQSPMPASVNPGPQPQQASSSVMDQAQQPAQQDAGAGSQTADSQTGGMGGDSNR